MKHVGRNGWLLFCVSIGSLGAGIACDDRPAVLVTDAGPDWLAIDHRDFIDRIRDFKADRVTPGEARPPGDCTAPAPPAPQCGASLCGNGKVDSCQHCSPGWPGPWYRDAGICTAITEVCDGSPGGNNCEGQGYVSGTLACGAWCDFDASSCTTCVKSANVQTCGRAGISAVDPHSVALVTTDSEIVVAWVSSGQGRSARLARFRPDLSLIMQTGCIGADVTGVALAATRTGYLLAVAGAAGTALHPLTAAGEPTGLPVSVVPGGSPYLVTRREPGKAIVGGPLLVSTAAPGTPSGRVGRLLGDAGVIEATLPTLINSPVESGYVSGVFTGDGFLYAERESSAGVTIVRIVGDKLTGKSSPVTSSTEYPQLAWNGSEGRLTYAHFGGPSMTRWMRIDRNGTPLGPAVTLGTIPEQFNRTPMIMVGDDTLLFLGGYSGTTDRSKHLDLMRIGAAGDTVTPKYRLVQDPKLARSHLLASRGPDAVALWVRGGYPGGIDLAVIKP